MCNDFHFSVTRQAILTFGVNSSLAGAAALTLLLLFRISGA